MKVRALAGLSGPFGSKLSGDEFTVAADVGKDLIDRKLAEAVTEAAVAKVDPKAKGGDAKE